ncbi:hypothetical protein HanXRQr2_Chr15g0676861 [Helianthus annuus]|uniref:Uncharacterized protein n=1 Tax=Helianthus annuus TaxID=4232 RepID=A0A9K3DX46_HELAN|nr:hypothetical protein HanXRQr2_Chr15g0676861 [Helianthus annuus]KAJ0829902.1 hypothetical protein HanPSC8_Chr15g0649091 [Helianthus annuus]
MNREEASSRVSSSVEAVVAVLLLVVSLPPVVGPSSLLKAIKAE